MPHHRPQSNGTNGPGTKTSKTNQNNLFLFINCFCFVTESSLTQSAIYAFIYLKTNDRTTCLLRCTYYILTYRRPLKHNHIFCAFQTKVLLYSWRNIADSHIKYLLKEEISRPVSELHVMCHWPKNVWSTTVCMCVCVFVCVCVCKRERERDLPSSCHKTVTVNCVERSMLERWLVFSNF
jgi:hypothetical protein